MSAHYYRLSAALAASLSLIVGGCGSERPAPPAAAAPTASATGPQPAAVPDDGTDQTIWTVLGISKRDRERNLGPQTGSGVSPVLWEAALDTLRFAGSSAEDPVTGLIVTKWYSPPAKPDERLRVTVFILSRALRSDSLTVTVERETRAAGSGWQQAPVAKEVVADLENAILLRARQIHAERYRRTMYN